MVLLESGPIIKTLLYSRYKNKKQPIELIFNLNLFPVFYFIVRFHISYNALRMHLKSVIVIVQPIAFYRAVALTPNTDD